MCVAVPSFAYLHEDVIGLRDEYVLLGDLLGPIREELRDRVRSVHHREAHITRILIGVLARAAAVELLCGDRRDLLGQLVVIAAVGRQKPRKAGDLGAFIPAHVLLQMVHHDARLPRLVRRILRGEHDVIRLATRRAARDVVIGRGGRLRRGGARMRQRLL